MVFKFSVILLSVEQDDMQNIREICSFTAEVLSDLRFDQVRLQLICIVKLIFIFYKVLEKTERILSWIPFQKTEVSKNIFFCVKYIHLLFVGGFGEAEDPAPHSGPVYAAT